MQAEVAAQVTSAQVKEQVRREVELEALKRSQVLRREERMRALSEAHFAQQAATSPEVRVCESFSWARCVR